MSLRIKLQINLATLNLVSNCKGKKKQNWLLVSLLEMIPHPWTIKNSKERSMKMLFRRLPKNWYNWDKSWRKLKCRLKTCLSNETNGRWHFDANSKDCETNWRQSSSRPLPSVEMSNWRRWTVSWTNRCRSATWSKRYSRMMRRRRKESVQSSGTWLLTSESFSCELNTSILMI